MKKRALCFLAAVLLLLLPASCPAEEECYHLNQELRGKVDADYGVPGYSGDVYCVDCGLLISPGEVTVPLDEPSDDYYPSVLSEGAGETDEEDPPAKADPPEEPKVPSEPEPPAEPELPAEPEPPAGPEMPAQPEPGVLPGEPEQPEPPVIPPEEPVTQPETPVTQPEAPVTQTEESALPDPPAARPEEPASPPETPPEPVLPEPGDTEKEAELPAVIPEPEPAEAETPAEPEPQAPAAPGGTRKSGWVPFSEKYPFRRVRMNPEPGIRAEPAGKLIWPRPESTLQQMLGE